MWPPRTLLSRSVHGGHRTQMLHSLLQSQAHIQSAHSQICKQLLLPNQKKLNRPIILKGCTNEDWGYFMSMWDIYQAATNISNADMNYLLVVTQTYKEIHTELIKY